MNCLCDIFDNSTTWLIIIALLILFYGCNSCCSGCGSSGAGVCGGGCGCTNHCC
ncbi:MAG: hypothetical protein IJF55_02550 [Clostridia bacterium]|nr:hypothetical protein [Clostridia bacterium]